MTHDIRWNYAIFYKYYYHVSNGQFSRVLIAFHNAGPYIVCIMKEKWKKIQKSRLNKAD